MLHQVLFGERFHNVTMPIYTSHFWGTLSSNFPSTYESEDANYSFVFTG